MNYNPNLYPPSGYVLTDAQGVRHRGESWRDLFRTVAAYRVRNGMPPGDPEAEVNAQQCALNPGLCSSDPRPLPPQRVNDSVNSRVLNWFANTLAGLRQFGALPRVNEAEAIRRSEICIRCPRQQPLSSACESCISSVAGARRTILGEKGSVNKALHPCRILGEDCQTSIHLKNEPVSEVGMPADCWRRE